MDEDRNFWTSTMARRISRRTALRGLGLGGAGLAGAALIGCGDDDDEAPSAAATAAPAATKAAGAAATTAAAPGAGPKTGGTFVTANRRPLNEVMDPHAATSAAWSTWTWMGNTALRSLREGGGVQPELIESWEQSAGGNEFVFHLANAKWHNKPPVNGRAWDAQDLLYNLDRIRGKLDPDNVEKYQRRSTIEGIVNAEAVDDRTVKVTLDQPRPGFLLGLADGRNSMVPRDFEDFTDNAGLVGTGPFIIETFQNEIESSYSRNPDYFLPPWPYLDGIRYVWVPDRLSLMTAVTQGEVDIFSSPVRSERETLSALRGDLNEVIWPGSRAWIGLRFNIKNKPFDDKRVRKALALVPDYHLIGDSFHGPGYWGLTGPLSSGFPEAYQADELAKIPGWRKEKEQDLKTANDLMAAAGFPNGEITWKASPGLNRQDAVHYDTVLRSVDAWQVHWPDMNLEMDLPADSAAFVAKMTSRVGWDLVSWIIAAVNDPVLDMFTQYHTDGSRNYGDYQDARIDSLLDDAAVEIDSETRTGMLKEAQDILIEEQPIVWLQVILTTAWYTKRMQGIEEVYGLELSHDIHQRGRHFYWIDEEA